MYKKNFLRWLIAVFAALTIWNVRAETATWANNSFQILCYHDVRDDAQVSVDPYAVTTKQLAQHFEWLRENGFNIISVDDILAARSGVRPLPQNAVLLTFDDGYESFYKNVFPLLKAFKYRAVQAVVGSWIEAKAKDVVIDTEAENHSTGDLMTWQQIKEVSDSGLVEIASHSYASHKGIPANPQKSMIPALLAHRYYSEANQYENNASYLDRIRADLQKNSSVIKTHTGKKPRVVVWPYGRYNQTTVDVAEETGMQIALTLESGANDATVPLNRLRRVLVMGADGDGIGQLDQSLRADIKHPIRVMHVDLDYVYDKDLGQQEDNVGKLLDRVRASGANTVFLQAFADSDGDGSASQAYFPNRHLPLRADLFSYVAWQLQTRANVNVYAWMPLSAFVLPAGHPVAKHTVIASDSKGANSYTRLSTFDPAVRKVIGEIYEDLATNAVFNGLLFHDDATLTDFEDDSPAARTVYQTWQLPNSVEAIRKDPAAFKKWTERKTQYLTEFSIQLADKVQRWQPRLKTARNMYAQVVLDPQSEAWFAQSLPNFLAHYDYTAIMAMPYMEGASEPLPWLHNLVKTVAAVPGGLEKSVFELQAVDWKTNKLISGKTLATQMETLLDAGARNYGYYPDDFPKDEPRLDDLLEIFSLRNFPYWGKK